MNILDNEKVKKYLDDVCREIKNKKVHESIREELVSHIEEIVDVEIDRCESEDKAIEKAISKMGNSEEVGKNLDKVHKAKPDYLLLGLTSALMFVGIFTLWFMGNSSGSGISGVYTDLAQKTVLYALIGGVFAFAIIKGDYRVIKRFSKSIYAGAIVLVVLGTMFSPVINGAKGYISIGPFSINSCYLSSFLLIISLSGMFDNYDWNSKGNTIKGLVLAFAPTILLAQGHSMGNVLIYGVSVAAIMIMSGIKIRYIISLMVASIGIVSVYVLNAAYRIDRVISFMNQSKDPYGQGYAYVRLKEIRNSSGLFLPSEPLNLRLLPDVHGEFILTYIMYSFGFVACAILISLVFMFIVRIGFIGAKAKDSYGKLLVSGLFIFFIVQFLINILMNFNLFPIMGMAMPFISYGGSSMLVSIISIGIITSVYKWRNTPFKAAERV